jgi:GT2 family glycosyltransferase
VARKKTLERAGLFDESLARCDDYDMWLRAAFHGAKIAYSRRVQARLADGRPGSLGASSARMTEAYWKILQKMDRTLPLTHSDRSAVQRRSSEAHGLYLLQEGKLNLRQGQFAAAKSLLSEANSYLRSPKISLVLLGLSLSPTATRSVASLVERIRD